MMAEKRKLSFSFLLSLPAKGEVRELDQLKTNWLDADRCRNDVPLVPLWFLIICNSKHHTSWSCCL